MGFSGGDDISHHLQMWSRVLIILLYHNFGVGLPQSLVNMDFQKLFSLRYVSTSHGRLIYNVKPSFLLVYSPNRLVCPHQSLEEVRFLSISSLWMLIYLPISVLDTYIETGVLVVNNGQFCREYRSLSKLFSAQGNHSPMITMRNLAIKNLSVAWCALCQLCWVLILISEWSEVEWESQKKHSKCKNWGMLSLSSV